MPSFYAIIPANIRYDKDLPANAKLLYGEITALCNEKGYCWATNGYFSELYGVSVRSISMWINSLVNKGYLKSRIKYKTGSKEIESRILSVASIPIEENFLTPGRKLPDPIEENFRENTTVNNTINNKYKGGIEIEQPFKSEPFKKAWEEWLQYRKEKRIPKYTDRGLKHAFKHLQDISFHNEVNAIKILEQSMGNGWQGLFQLKNGALSTSHVQKNPQERSRYQQQLEENRMNYTPIPE